MASNLNARVRDVLAGPVAGAGVDLEDVEVRAAGRRRLVRVSIDTDGGVTLDDVAAVTRVVSKVLDDSDVMGDQAYILEVGSPGVSRPLTLPRHWRRNVGRLVRIALAEGSEPFMARISSVQGDDPATAIITVVTADEELQIAPADVTRAVIQVEINRPDGSTDGH